MALGIKSTEAIKTLAKKLFRYLSIRTVQLKKSYKAVAVCTVHSILLVFISYLWMNLPWELPDEQLITKVNQIIRFIVFEDSQRTQQLHDRFLFINCSYDKALTDYGDEHGDGQIAITDRAKITHLLSVLNGAKEKPRVIVIDLLFQDVSSDQDSLMLTEMGRTNNLILGWDDSMGNLDLPKSVTKAEAYYYSSSGSFLKYPVITNTANYLPAAIYTNLHPESNPRLNRVGFVATENGLWLNSFIVDVELRARHLNHFNLGEFVSIYAPEEIEALAKDKIIILGEYFRDDQHDTVLGTQPGPLLVANTYLALEKGQATITWLGSILLMLFYFAASWRIATMKIEGATGLTQPNRPKLIRFLLKYITYLLVFSAFSIIIYQLLGTHLQILLFAFYFNAIEFAMKRYDFFKGKIIKLIS